MGTTEISKSAMCNEMQYDGFFSEFELIDANIIFQVTKEDKIPAFVAADPTVFL